MEKVLALSDYDYELVLYNRIPNITLLEKITSLRQPPDWNRLFLNAFYNQDKIKCKWILSSGKVDLTLILDTKIDYILLDGSGMQMMTPMSIIHPNIYNSVRFKPVHYAPPKQGIYGNAHIYYIDDFVKRKRTSPSFLKWIVYLCIRNGTINNIPREIFELVQREETSLLFTISLMKQELMDDFLFDENILMIELPKYVLSL